jgi:hypothetical protein
LSFFLSSGVLSYGLSSHRVFSFGFSSDVVIWVVLWVVIWCCYLGFHLGCYLAFVIRDYHPNFISTVYWKLHSRIPFFSPQCSVSNFICICTSI